MVLDVARATTTSDAFNAIAEPCRRQILMAIADGEAGVNEIVARVGMLQPAVSKHLGVLKTVNLVRCRTEGRRRLYRVNPDALRPVDEWLRTFEAQWNDRLDRLDDLLADVQEHGR
jgi:DNA-binding transcriptional ArsR family regulator